MLIQRAEFEGAKRRETKIGCEVGLKDPDGVTKFSSWPEILSSRWTMGSDWSGCSRVQAMATKAVRTAEKRPA